MKKFTRFAIASASALALIGGGVYALPSAKADATASGKVATPAGQVLFVRSAPSVNAQRDGQFSSGHTITISCQSQGDNVEGPWGVSNVWDFVEGHGFVADAWVETGHEGRIAGVPDCATYANRDKQPPAPATTAGSGTVSTPPGQPLFIRSTPSLSADKVGTFASGEKISIECQTEGDPVDGPWGTISLWNRVPGRGYVADAWLDTGHMGRIPGVPDCGLPKPTAPDNGYQYPYTGKFYLPTPKGSAYPVTQGPGGSWSHFDQYNLHAVDLGTPNGTPLYAPGPGVIAVAGWNNYGSGNEILIDHGNNVCTLLGHLSGFGVKAGDKVTAGALVGWSGNTGNSTGPHLHWGMINCQTRVSIDTPNTVETGRNFGAGSTPVSQNPTRG